MYSVRYFCAILTKAGVSRQIFIKLPNIKFRRSPSGGSRAVTRGQTDGHEEANSRFLRLCGRAWNITEFWDVAAVLRRVYIQKLRRKLLHPSSRIFLYSSGSNSFSKVGTVNQPSRNDIAEKNVTAVRSSYLSNVLKCFYGRL